MKKIYLTIHLFALTVALAAAQLPYATIKGHVFNHDTRLPVAGQTMIISADSLNSSGYHNKVVTDETGFYTDSIQFNPGSSQIAITVSTYECNGTLVKSTAYSYPNSTDVILDFLICGNQANVCVAKFKTQPVSNNTLSFFFMDFSYSSYGANLFKYLWDFGDGTTSTEQSLLHTFDKPGNYNVCLNIVKSNDSMCSSSFCLPVTVDGAIPGSCENSFWYYNDSTGKQYIFEGSVKNGKADTWMWNFGDGTTATGQKVSHSFANTNVNHTVCLTTTGVDANGTTCTHSYCQDIYTYIPAACESSFFYYTDSIGSNYTFEGYAKNNQVSYWAWDFGDGTTATGQKVSHSFNFNSTVGQNVCLTTIGIGASGDSCIFKSCQNIFTNPPSTCENHIKTYSEGGSKYTFTGGVASGINSDYYWNFGDGTSDTGQVVTHTFGKIYTIFNVCLTTVVSVPAPTGFYECKSISCQTIYNGNDSSSCNAVFGALPDSSKNTYRFINQSQSNYSYSYWDFGDGSQTTESNPVHTYSSPGLFVVCLTIADNTNNCKSQSCQEIWVDMIQPGCKASFTAVLADSSNSTTSGYLFFNTSAPGYTNQKWSFGDGTVSTEFNPVHVYNSQGVYTACLTIWDSLGKCQSSNCMDISVGKITNDNTVSGIVLAGNNVADHGIVWLISPDKNYNAELIIDSTGIFHFTGVPYGSYYIYAMLTPGSDHFFAFMPTYYASSLSWQGATLIHTGEPNAWYAVSLVPSMYLSQGDATITGTISWGLYTVKAEGIPAANVEVVLYNNSGNPIAYTFTNNEGSFEFNNLPFGDYTVQAEMPGKATQIISISLSESSAGVNIDFRVNESAVYILGLDKLNKSKILAGNPYPNPVKDILTLELNVPVSGTATIEVIDMQGRVIHRELSDLSQGQNQIRIQATEFKQGVYQLRIKTDGQKLVQRRFVR